jgi:hypothetical protein
LHSTLQSKIITRLLGVAQCLLPSDPKQQTEPLEPRSSHTHFSSQFLSTVAWKTFVPRDATSREHGPVADRPRGINDHGDWP